MIRLARHALRETRVRELWGEVVALDPRDQHDLLTPADVATLLHVDPRTVTRWAAAGKLSAIRTPGGHRRYSRSEVLAIVAGLRPEDDPDDQAAAAAVVAEAVALALEAAAAEAAEAVLVTAAAVSEAASRVAVAAEKAKGARAFAADAASRSVAREARRTAAQVRIRAASAADQVHRAASQAADELARSREGGPTIDVGRLAVLLDDTVRVAAEATAQATTRAAAGVLDDESAAATRVARSATDLEQDVDRAVTATADAQRRLATAAAVAMARKVEARAAGVAIAAREAAAALVTTEPRTRAADHAPALDPPGPGRSTLDTAREEARLTARGVRRTAAVTPYAITTLDPDGVVASWSTGASRMEDHPHDAPLGRDPSVLQAPEAGLRETLIDTARAAGSSKHTGWRIRSDGSRFWADTITSAVRDHTGGLTGFVEVTRDLTESRRLQVAQESFYDAFKHDFRVPITAIKGFAELIGDAAPEDQAHLIERVESNANRLLTMVGGLVDYAQLRSGLVPITLQAVDLVALAQRAVANLASIAPTARVRVTATTPVTVLADPAALERVVSNLVTNALKYSPATSDVTLVCERLPDTGRLRIVDHGRGIDARDLDSIFLDFERGRLAQHDDAGTGLGLASVQRLVDLQAGTVEITSEVQVGTTVTISLPLAPSTDSS